MILKGSQRSGARQLSAHLMNGRDNEHVDLHELRGFAGTNLDDALQEAHAVSRGTRCKQFLFSLSLNPPRDASVSTQQFLDALDKIETTLGLSDQPRAVVFHEKNGRRHAHAVWSRIDTGQMRAINLPHYKLKLRDLSRDLFLEHGWTLPKGLVDKRERDPLSFTHEEWQQASRKKLAPAIVKSMFQNAWASTSGRHDFQQALEAQGFFVARGDRRSVVALDVHGEVYALSKWTGQKAKAVKERLGDLSTLRSVSETRELLAARMAKAIEGFAHEVNADLNRKEKAIGLRRDWMVEKHRGERETLKKRQEERWKVEEITRSERLPRGLKIVWSWLKGEYRTIRRQNERETDQAKRRDQIEQDRLSDHHRKEFRSIGQELEQARQTHTQKAFALQSDLARFMQLGAGWARSSEHTMQNSTERTSVPALTR